MHKLFIILLVFAGGIGDAVRSPDLPTGRAGIGAASLEPNVPSDARNKQTSLAEADETAQWEWLNELTTNVRTAWGDDDPPVELLREVADGLHAHLRHLDASTAQDFFEALQYCSWTLALPEPRDEYRISVPIVGEGVPGLGLESRPIRGGLTDDFFRLLEQVVVTSVDRDSQAFEAGVAPGMTVHSVRGVRYPRNAINDLDGRLIPTFTKKLKGEGPAVVEFSSPTIEQRRWNGIYKCAQQVQRVCDAKEERPLEFVARLLEDTGGTVFTLCARRDPVEAKYQIKTLTQYLSESDAFQQTLKQRNESGDGIRPCSDTDVVTMYVPHELVDLTVTPSAVEGKGLEMSNGRVAVDTAASRENCLYAGMVIAEINGQRLDAEEALYQIIGAWAVVDSTRVVEVEPRGEDLWLKDASFESPLVLAADGWWETAKERSSNGRKMLVRLHSDGQLRISGGETKRAERLPVVQRLKSGAHLKVRPFGGNEVRAQIWNVEDTTVVAGQGCKIGETKVKLAFCSPNDAGRWWKAFNEARDVTVSITDISTRPHFKCGAFLRDSFKEVSTTLQNQQRTNGGFAALKLAISITAGVTVLAFPPLALLHGVAHLGAALAVSSVGTSLKAGVNGVQRVTMGGEFDLAQFGTEVAIGVSVGTLSAGVGFGVASGLQSDLVGLHVAEHISHHIGHGTGEIVDKITNYTLDHAAHGIVHGQEHGHQDQHDQGNDENQPDGKYVEVSEECSQVLFPQEGAWY